MRVNEEKSSSDYDSPSLQIHAYSPEEAFDLGQLAERLRTLGVECVQFAKKDEVWLRVKLATRINP